MKKLYLLTASLLTISLSAQQITFQRVYDVGLGFERILDVQQAPDGGYIFVGDLQVTANEAIVIRTDAQGDTLWTRVMNFGVGGSGSAESVEPLGNGWLIAGSHTLSSGTQAVGFLMVVDDAGNITQYANYELPGANGKVGMVLSAGGFALAGIGRIVSNSYLTLIRTDGALDTSWTKAYGFSDINGLGDAIETTDGGFALVGGRSKEVLVVRTAPNGDTSWTRQYGGNSDEISASLAETSDGGFVVLAGTHSFGTSPHANTLLLRLDSNGDTLWTRVYASGGVEVVRNMTLTSDGGVAIVGRTDASLQEDVYVLRLDANGDTLWTRSYGDMAADDDGYVIKQTADGGFIIAGSTRGFRSGLSEQVYVIKTDSLGNSGCNERQVDWLPASPSVDRLNNLIFTANATPSIDTLAPGITPILDSDTVCIEVVTGFSQTQKDVVALVPNPASGFVLVTGMKGEDVTVRLADTRGRLLMTTSTDLPFVMNTSGLASGMYFVEVMSGLERDCQPLIVR